MKDSQCGGCGCSGGRRTRKIRRGGQTFEDITKKIQERQAVLKGKGKKVGGTVIGDALLAGTALGLYSYFTRKRGGQRRLPKRKTMKALV
jgi:hypothetical protein